MKKEVPLILTTVNLDEIYHIVTKRSQQGASGELNEVALTSSLSRRLI